MIPSQKLATTDASKHSFSGWFWALIGGFLVLLLFLTMAPTVGPYDEGLILYGALNVLHGRLPFRDFWSFYGPGQYYLLAVLFRFFGVYVFLGRIVYVVTMLLTSFAVIGISHLLGGRRLPGVVCAVISIIWAAAGAMYLYPVYSALCLSLGACLCMIMHWRSEMKYWLCLAGTIIACEIFFRHDLAFYSFVALLVGECYYHLNSKRYMGRPMLERLIVDVGCFAASIAIVGAPGLVYLLRRIPFSDIRYQLFYFPSHIYPMMRRLPFFSGGVASLLADSIILIPPILAVSIGLCIMDRRWRERLQVWQISGFVAVGGLMLVVPISGLVRSNITHEAPSGIVCSLVLACLLPTISFAGRTGRTVTLTAAVCFLVATLGPVRMAFRTAKSTAALFMHPRSKDSLVSLCHPPAGLERATCVEIDPVETQVVEYIQRQTAPNEKVYSGTGRNDKLFVNDMLFYFLSKRDAATKWYYDEPGLETTYPIQAQVIRDLDRNHAEYVIRNLTWDDDCEPNASCQSSGVTVLDQYIDANYRTVATFPKVLILRRSTPFR